MVFLRLTSTLIRIGSFYCRQPVRAFSSHYDYPPDVPAPHRTSNPVIQLSIRLSKASSIFEIYSILESPKAILSHTTFALRIIGRIIKHAPSKKYYLLDKRFFDLLAKLEEGIDQLGNQEINDISFFWRTYLLVCKRDLLTVEGEKKYIKRMHELIDENAFMFRHLVSIIYDLSVIGITSKKLDEAIINGLMNKNEIMNAADLKQILISCIKNKRESSKSMISLCLERLDSVEEERMDTMHSIILLQELQQIGSPDEYPQLKDIFSKICNIIEKRISALTEFEVLNSIEFLAPRVPFKMPLFISLLEKIKVNLEKDPGGFSKWFIIGALRVALNTDKSICPTGLEDLAIQDIVGKIRNNVFPFTDIEEIITVYEKSNLCMPYELGLAIKNINASGKIDPKWLFGEITKRFGNVKVLDKNKQEVLLTDFINAQNNN
ncbi:unnamed protein product [Blepharisma stoltei]|uniref:Uncharacterized protein n=1 Tax=Blepharisma stoltei TaxID=1481888 RepID=A0AAU9J9B9_9CILI|nr:unnamed protein product [Blepharisma stoltei]